MDSRTDIPAELTRMNRDDLVKLIKSERGPWSGRRIELQDRATLERLARLACRVRAVRSSA